MSRPTQAELDRDEALVRAALGWNADHFLAQLDHNWLMRGYLHQVLNAARTGGVTTVTTHGETGIKTTVHDGYIRQSVEGCADAVSTTIQVTVPDQPAADEQDDRLYLLPITWTHEDTWTIRASSPEEALEIAKDQGIDCAEKYTHDQYPQAEYGEPELLED